MNVIVSPQVRKIAPPSSHSPVDAPCDHGSEQDDAALCGATTLRLALADVERSGLSSEQALAEGMFPTDNASSINPDFANAPAIIIPYYDSKGHPLTYERDGRALPFCRARYLAPPGFPLPRKRKYDQPNDSGTPPYFSRSFDWTMAERGELEACLLVEGEKKSVALCAAGFPAVAIGGVFNFSDGSAPLHPALAKVAGHCRAVYVVFDSDAASKPQIQMAECRLAGQLVLLGVRVHIVRIPAEGDEKVGADDFLVKHGAAAFSDLVMRTPALGATAALSNDDVFTISEILGRDVTPVEELIPGWIEKGIPNFIAGPGGVHKSRLAMQWGLSINAGAAVWGIDAGLDGLKQRKATLVLCAAEDDANELARRAQAICRALKLKTAKQGVFLARKAKDSALVIMGESADVEVRPFYHELVARLRAIPGHKIVVLDSAYDFVRFAGRAKIDEDAVNYFIKVVLQGLCDQTDSTLLIPWHPSQAGSERESMDGWSVAWHNAPRARLALKAVKDVPDTYELSVAKRNHGRKGEPLKLRFHEGALLPVDAVPDDGKTAAFRQAMVREATDAARLQVPLNRRDRVPDIVVKKGEEMLGRRPSKNEIKDALEEAVRNGELKYLPSTRHQAAGYYPPDAELARDLAHAAKRAGKEEEDV
jgi:hypothetical protein